MREVFPYRSNGPLPEDAPDVDLLIEKVVVLQVVEKSEYLVAGKPTAVRVLVGSKGRDVWTEVSMNITKDGKTVWKGVKRFNAKRKYEFKEIRFCRDSANFFNRTFPNSSGTYFIRVAVDPDNKIDEIYEWNNYGCAFYRLKDIRGRYM